MIDFDRDTGRLRLDQPAFGALVDHLTADTPGVGGGPVDDALLGELRAAGVLHGDEPAPPLVPAVRAVRGAAVQIRMTVASATQAVFHQGWVGGATTALLLQTRGPEHELLTLPTLLVPGLLASTGRVGPRRVRATEPFTPGTDLMDDLLSLGDDERRTAFAGVRGVAPQPLAEADALWSWGVEAAWKDPDGELAGSWLQVLDSPAGTWARDEDRFVPSSGTEIWRALVMLLPDDDELAEDVREALAAASA